MITSYKVLTIATVFALFFIGLTVTVGENGIISHREIKKETENANEVLKEKEVVNLALKSRENSYETKEVDSELVYSFYDDEEVYEPSTKLSTEKREKKRTLTQTECFLISLIPTFITLSIFIILDKKKKKDEC